MGAQAPTQFRRKPLNPAPDGGVIDWHASVSEQFLHIPVGQAEAQVPPNRAKDDLGLEMPPLEDERALPHVCHLAPDYQPPDLCNTTHPSCELSVVEPLRKESRSIDQVERTQHVVSYCPITNSFTFNSQTLHSLPSAFCIKIVRM
jgi:hypothetical protein